MKKIFNQSIEDFMLWLLSFIGVFNLIDSVVNLNFPSVIIIYWSFFAVLIADRLFFKKITSLLFWKFIFIIGVVLFIIKNISSILLLMEIYQKNTYDIWSGVLMLMLLNVTILLFIYRSFKFITKGV